MAHELRVGAQVIEFGDEGVVVFRLNTTMQPNEAEMFVHDMHEYQERHNDSVLIVDLTKAHGIEPKARKAIIDGVNSKPYAVCFIGACFGMKALVGLMLNASRVLGKAYPFKFVATEDEARAWAKTLPGGWGI
jgi:hypothetical protein